MEGNGFDRTAITETDEKILTAATAEPRSTSNIGQERRKYIEDVDDLDLYMKIYPEVKRRRDEAERQVKLVEAEIKRREDLRFFAPGTKSFVAKIFNSIRLLMRSVSFRILADRHGFKVYCKSRSI
jgi:hypothetical protein